LRAREPSLGPLASRSRAGGHPRRNRFATAATLRFDAVECHFPHQLPKEELHTLLRDNGLRFIYGVVPVDCVGALCASLIWVSLDRSDALDQSGRK